MNNNCANNSKSFENHKDSENKNINLDKNYEILNANDSLNKLPNSNSSINLKQDLVIEKSEVTKLDATHFGDWQINCKTIDF